MFRFFLCTALATGFLVSSAFPAVYDSNETPEDKQKRMGWYLEDKFGMFIHWGIYSQLGGTYNGERFNVSLKEHIFNQLKIPYAEYEQVAEEFNPEQFNAEEVVLLAKKTGMKYIVITAKHHDGFAMYDSDVSDWNIVDRGPLKRDVTQELKDACDKYGLVFGVYYSHAWDWYHPGGIDLKDKKQKRWDPRQEGTSDEYVHNIVIPQLKEIIKKYDPKILWFDVGGKLTDQALNDEIGKTIKEIAPDIVVNPRLNSKTYIGDFETAEQSLPVSAPEGSWEFCDTMSGSWGWVKPEVREAEPNIAWRDPGVVLKRVVGAWGMGGNVLLNIGPHFTGSIDPGDIERMKYVEDWMRVNGAAVYGSTKSPFYSQPWEGTMTKVERDGKTFLYAHLFEWPEKGRLEIIDLPQSVKGVKLLGGRKLKFSGESPLVVLLPKKPVHDAINVIEFELNGSVPDAINNWPVLDQAELELDAKSMKPFNFHETTVERVDGFIVIGEIKRFPVQPTWKVDVKKAGRYKVFVEYVAEEEHTLFARSLKLGASFRFDEKKETTEIPYVTLPASTTVNTVGINTLDLKEGLQVLSITPKRKNWKGVLKIKTVGLKKI